MTDIIPERDDKTPKIEYLVLFGAIIQIVLYAKLLLQIILLGANDAVLPVPGTTQHVPIEDYEKNLEYIINHPHIKQHNPKILLVTPPPVDEIRSGELDKADGFDASIRETNVSATYSQCVRDISARYPDIILVDLWKGIMDKAIELTPNDYTPGGPWLGSLENGNRGGLKSLIPDGLHLSGDGYRVFWELTKPHIGSEWVPGDMSEWVYPAWARFDADGNI